MESSGKCTAQAGSHEFRAAANRAGVGGISRLAGAPGSGNCGSGTATAPASRACQPRGSPISIAERHFAAQGAPQAQHFRSLRCGCPLIHHLSCIKRSRRVKASSGSARSATRSSRCTEVAGAGHPDPSKRRLCRLSGLSYCSGVTGEVRILCAGGSPRHCQGSSSSSKVPSEGSTRQAASRTL